MPRYKNLNFNRIGYSKYFFMLKTRILFIVSQIEIQIYFSRLLKRMNCEVDLINTVQAAISLYNRGYDLIFYDNNLLNDKNSHITHRLRLYEQNLGIQVPIIIIGSDHRKLNRNLDINDVVEKNCSFLDLQKIFVKWLKS